MKEAHVLKVEQLIGNGSYQEALDYYKDNLRYFSESLYVYNLRNYCLSKLGRQTEMHEFSWNIVNVKQPDDEDLEAVDYISLAMKANHWDLEGDYFANISRFMRDSFVLSDFRSMEKELLQEIIQSEQIDTAALLKLCRYYYSVNDVVKAGYYHALYLKLTGTRENANEIEEGVVLSKVKNMGALYAILLEDTTDTLAFVIHNKDNYNSYFKMAEVCKYLGKKAIFITVPVEWEIEGDLPDIDTSLDLSYDNSEMINDVNCMTSIRYHKNNVKVEETLLSLLDDLSKKVKGNQLPVFAERGIFMSLKSPHVKRSVLHYVVSNEEVKNSPFRTNFGYINGYENFEGMMYQVNIIDQIKKESKYAYSIVIPARNNAVTLEYTLKTCFEQEFKDYEILISDNSDDDNYNIKKLLKDRFDSDKIRYIRTPRVLPITKSFEYAFINAMGDFLVPIGADDGLVFNSLKYLDKTIKNIEKTETLNNITWDRLHYVWPDFTESGQESQFIIPRLYQNGVYEFEKCESIQKLKDILIYPKLMYSSPLCYINSGMKRQYMLTMLEKTGAILDGHSQDLYTGIVNLALNQNYYHLKFPIVMAALSGYSSGVESAIGTVDDSILQKRAKEYFLTNYATPVQRDSEDLFMVSDGDVANMLTQVLRIIDMEVLDTDLVKYIYWENIGKKILEQMQYKDVNRKKVETMLIKGIEFFTKDTAKTIKSNIEQGIITPNRYDLVKDKSYFTGFKENGALHLNASKLGINNVYDACKLFDNIYNIY